MNEELSPFDFQYKPNQTVEIAGNVILNLLVFFQKVLESQPKMAVPYVYASAVDIKKDKDGEVVSVKTDWEYFPKLESFLQTIEAPIPIATELSILAEQFNYAFTQLHNVNIEKGLATKVETINKEKADEQVSHILDKSNKKAN